MSGNPMNHFSYERRHEEIRSCIRQIRDADDGRLIQLAEQLAEKRRAWFETHIHSLGLRGGSALERAYGVFLAKLSLSPSDAPIVERGATRIIIRSRNFCPTLEACLVLGLDTRRVCSLLTERPMDMLLKLVDRRLRFTRNYDAIRPYSAYCEEMILLGD